MKQEKFIEIVNVKLFNLVSIKLNKQLYNYNI